MMVRREMMVWLAAAIGCGSGGTAFGQFDVIPDAYCNGAPAISGTPTVCRTWVFEDDPCIRINGSPYKFDDGTHLTETFLDGWVRNCDNPSGEKIKTLSWNEAWTDQESFLGEALIGPGNLNGIRDSLRAEVEYSIGHTIVPTPRSYDFSAQPCEEVNYLLGLPYTKDRRARMDHTHYLRYEVDTHAFGDEYGGNPCTYGPQPWVGGGYAADQRFVQAGTRTSFIKATVRTGNPSGGPVPSPCEDCEVDDGGDNGPPAMP